MEIREIQRKDYKRAIQFAIEGMHFNWYMKNRLVLLLYGRYFWYLELGRATHVIAAYDKGKLLGVLLARFKDTAVLYRSLAKRLYVVLFDRLQRVVAGREIEAYHAINKEMYQQYCKTHTPDGELVFLAVDTTYKKKGVGTFLLDELEQREPGKTIYLYTDSGCSYQFYDRRGFDRAEQRNIVLELQGENVPLTCFLYNKQFP